MLKATQFGNVFLALALATTSALAYAGDLGDKAHDKAYNKARFEAADTNDDGFLSRSEAAANMRTFEGAAGGKRFDAADTDDDGLMSFEEAKAYKRIEKEERGPAVQRAQDRHYDRARFEELDTNDDGYVSREEARADRAWFEQFGGSKRFNMADSDDDGKLSLEEARAQKMKEREAY